MKINGIRREDFGRYNCHVSSNETKIVEKNATVIITGVPYAPSFDPYTLTDTAGEYS